MQSCGEVRLAQEQVDRSAIVRGTLATHNGVGAHLVAMPAFESSHGREV